MLKKVENVKSILEKDNSKASFLDSMKKSSLVTNEIYFVLSMLVSPVGIFYRIYNRDRRVNL